jgi:hypothetical protein
LDLAALDLAEVPPSVSAPSHRPAVAYGAALLPSAQNPAWVDNETTGGKRDLTRKNLCYLDLKTTSSASYCSSLPTAPRRIYLATRNRETVMCARIHVDSSYPQSYLKTFDFLLNPLLVFHKKKEQKKTQIFFLAVRLISYIPLIFGSRFIDS